MDAGVWVWVAAGATGCAVWCWLPPPLLRRLSPRPASPLLTDARATLVRGVERLRDRVYALWTGRQARDATLRASVPQVCDLLAVCLDAGRPPRAALRVVRGVVDEVTAAELDRVLTRIDLGVDEGAAWGVLADVPGYRAVACDLARGVMSGVGLSATLRTHARDARRDAQARELARARSAGVHSVVPMMICFLPAFLFLGVAPIFGAVLARALG